MNSTPLYNLAYIDPGTGSMLIYAIIGLVSSMLYAVRGAYYRLAAVIFGTVAAKFETIPGAEIVFYSEGGHYWRVFAPVIKALNERAVPCVYISSDENDPGLDCELEHVFTKCIGGHYRLAAYLNNISAKIVAMTTPQLDIFHLRRSKNVDHYAHIMHTSGEILTFQRFAFDYFDSVLCSGPHQVDSIRKLEEARGTPRKLLLQTGLTYFDSMLGDKTTPPAKKDGEITVLVAPSWGVNASITRFGIDFFRALLNNPEFKVIFRPHPQTLVSQIELFNEIKSELREYRDVTIDTAPSPAAVLAESDIVITDFSAIVFDCVFLLKKPVVTVDCELNFDGFEGEYIPDYIDELFIQNQVGHPLNETDFDELPAILRKLVSDQSPIDLDKLREKYVYNFGNAGETAAEQLLQIMKELA